MNEVTETRVLYTKLFHVAAEQGHTPQRIEEAIGWAAIQLDPEADDYGTWEATVLARLENLGKGER
jgi:hypothetical protein